MKVDQVLQRSTPIALFGLIGFVVWQVVGTAMVVWPAVDAILPAGVVLPLAVLVSLALFASLIAAIYLLASDDRIPRSSFRVWVPVLIFTNIVGGSAFVVWWSRKRKHLPA
jgi:hypothetical protein